MESGDGRDPEDIAYEDRIRTSSLSELEDMSVHVDPGEYPHRARKLIEEIGRRRAGPEPGFDRRTVQKAVPAGLPRRLWASLIDLFIHLLILGALFLAGWSVVQLVSSPGSDGPLPAVSARRGPSPLQQFAAGLLAGDAAAWKNREQWIQVGLVTLSFLIFRALFTVPAWVRTGSTPGMREVGIRLIRTTGESASVNRALIRFWGQFLLFGLTLGVSAFWMVWDPRTQALHDKLTDTCVVREQRTWEKPDEDRVYD
ncbi:MAG: RDD family protein [Gemmatimonadota bacterium]|nr:RDD family protein [Gemmatimonadota bacterium]